MDFEWMAIAMGDVAWITIAYAFGLLSRLIGLPPMVGYLAAGFVLHGLGQSAGPLSAKLADLGITLLLFTVGLKLDRKVLTSRHVGGTAVIHGLLTVALVGSILLLLPAGFLFPGGMTAGNAFLIAFALSFSSTVFAVKMLEEKGEMKSLHGRTAIGILVIQDLMAVIFLAFSQASYPSPWAAALLLVIPLRPLIFRLLEKSGHGELLVIFGMVMALGGAEAFELCGIKDDLGALFFGALIARHPKAKELTKSMTSFKDLFLVGFFLNIGMSGPLSPEMVGISLFLLLLIPLKSVLYFQLMIWFRLRARTSLLAGLSLSNFSEFGLIVSAYGVSRGWLSQEVPVIIALALALSFFLAAPVSHNGHTLYTAFGPFWRRFQRGRRLPGDHPLELPDADIAVFGMGRVGTGVYDRMREIHGNKVMGFDFDPTVVDEHSQAGRRVLRGDPADPDFWEKVDRNHRFRLILLSLPTFAATIDALEQLKEFGFRGDIAAATRYQDEVKKLKEKGASVVFNIYTEAGSGFAGHVNRSIFRH